MLEGDECHSEKKKNWAEWKGSKSRRIYVIVLIKEVSLIFYWPNDVSIIITPIFQSSGLSLMQVCQFSHDHTLSKWWIWI